MKEWVTNVYAVLAIAPFLSFFAFRFGFLAFVKDGKRATAFAMDMTTILLVGTVSAMSEQMFGSGSGSLYVIILFMLLAAGLVGGAQNRLKGAVNPRRLLRVVWRLSFVALGAAYIVMSLVALVKIVYTL